MPDYLDSNGYPTESVLRKIRKWPIRSFADVCATQRRPPLWRRRSTKCVGAGTRRSRLRCTCGR